MARRYRITPDRAVLLGVLATVALYCRDLRYDFILDDVPLILMNQTIASWWNWKLVFTHHIFFSPGAQVPVQFTAIHYRPVYMLWLMANQSLFGAVVPWWHLTSLLLHICAIFLVYRAGLRILNDGWTAALGALLFALHPIHIESVSYVSASTDLLVTVFLLISFLLYAKYREEQNAPLAILIASIFAAALAMLSKESAAMYPPILIAYELLHGKTNEPVPSWKRFAPAAPFFAVVGIYTMVRWFLFGPNLGPGPGISRLAALTYSPLVLLVYLKNLFWAWPLSFYYPVEWVWQWTPAKSAALILIAAAGIILWRRNHDRPDVRLLLLWMAILFITPVMAVSAFLREDWVHDRHMYLVSVPFCLLVAALLGQVRMPRNAKSPATSLILAILFAATSAQLGRFSDADALYAATLKIAPRNVLAHEYRAYALWNYGERDAALLEFRISSELSPADATLHGGYAGALAEIGQNVDAEAEYEKALQCSPGSTAYRAYVLYRLAVLELKLARNEEAEAHIFEALQIAPAEATYKSVLIQAREPQRGNVVSNSAEQKPRLSPVSAGSQSVQTSTTPVINSR